MAAIATKEAVHSPNVALLKEPTSTHLEYTGPYKHPSQPLRTPRPLRIIVVGAGVSGIAAVKLFRETFPNGDVELVLYEKNADVTGTWLENRYPGCACDVPAHAYTYSWEGNPTWTRPYVGAEELYTYFKGRAVAYGVDDFVKLEHKVTAAKWDQVHGKWSVQIQNLRDGSSFTDDAEVLINAAGFLNSWKWPEIPGLDSFAGKLLHSARWDNSYDFKDKTVVVIGSGSSAIQIVPQLLPSVKHLYSINRSKTWIIPEFGAEFAPKGRASIFSEDQKAEWVSDKEKFLGYRKSVESSLNAYWDMMYKGSSLQVTAAEDIRKRMKERLGHDEELINKLGKFAVTGYLEYDDLIKDIVPEFEVGCRRPTPGHGYLEALTAPNVTVKTSAIESGLPTGLKLADGSLIEADAIVCATGFDTSFRPPFPVVGFDQDLRETWKDEPRSYLSIAAAGIPNYFITSGPNFPVGNGSLIPCLEANIRYAFAAANKIRHEGIQSLAPKQSAVDDFQEYKDSLMEDLVWSGSCVSWYKNGKQNGKVWGPWPGSSLTYLETMSSPRWEDYEITYLSKNRFDYFGNGRSRLQTEGGDLSYYLREPGTRAG